MIAIADTTPLNHLIQIQEADLLGELYGRVIIPPAVLAEMQAPDTPSVVRKWMNHRAGLAVAIPPQDRCLANLDLGESEAITLAEQLHAELFIMDDREGRQEAVKAKSEGTNKKAAGPLHEE